MIYVYHHHRHVQDHRTAYDKMQFFPRPVKGSWILVIGIIALFLLEPVSELNPEYFIASKVFAALPDGRLIIGYQREQGHPEAESPPYASPAASVNGWPRIELSLPAIYSGYPYRTDRLTAVSSSLFIIKVDRIYYAALEYDNIWKIEKPHEKVTDVHPLPDGRFATVSYYYDCEKNKYEICSVRKGQLTCQMIGTARSWMPESFAYLPKSKLFFSRTLTSKIWLPQGDGWTARDLNIHGADRAHTIYELSSERLLVRYGHADYIYNLVTDEWHWIWLGYPVEKLVPLNQHRFITQNSAKKNFKIWTEHEKEWSCSQEEFPYQHLIQIDGHDGCFITTCSGSSLIWDCRSGHCFSSELQGIKGEIKKAMMLSDGRVVTLSSDWTLTVWHENSSSWSQVVILDQRYSGPNRLKPHDITELPGDYLAASFKAYDQYSNPQPQLTFIWNLFPGENPTTEKHTPHAAGHRTDR